MWIKIDAEECVQMNKKNEEDSKSAEALHAEEAIGFAWNFVDCVETG